MVITILLLIGLLDSPLYECLNYGIKIKRNSIIKVDEAINYLKEQNLSPHDIHFKNIIQTNDSIVIIDVSDFLNFEYCHLWESSKKFYNIYEKFPAFPIPKLILVIGRIVYKKFYMLKLACLKMSKQFF